MKQNWLPNQLWNVVINTEEEWPFYHYNGLASTHQAMFTNFFGGVPDVPGAETRSNSAWAMPGAMLPWRRPTSSSDPHMSLSHPSAKSGESTHTHTHTLTRRTAPHRDRPCNAIHRGHRPRQRQRRPRAISWRRATLPPSRPHGVLLSYLTVFEADESATHACSSYWSTKLTFVIRIIFINIMTYWIN